MKKKLVIICLVGILALGLFSLVGCNANIQKVEGKYYWYEENYETGETQIHKDIYFELFADGTCTLNCLSNDLKDYFIKDLEDRFSAQLAQGVLTIGDIESFAESLSKQESKGKYEKLTRKNLQDNTSSEYKTLYHVELDESFNIWIGRATIYNGILSSMFNSFSMIFLKDGVNSPYIEKDNVLYRLASEDVFYMHEVADKSVSSVIIAPSIDGMNVKFIDLNAFIGCNELQSLTLSPPTETTFIDIISCCPKLKDIFINSDIDNALYLDDVHYGLHYGWIDQLPQYVTLHFDKSDKEIYKVTVLSPPIFDGCTSGEICYYIEEGSKIDNICIVNDDFGEINETLIGYAKAKTDDNGDPVLIKERRYPFDRGVPRGENGSKLYYDYDKNDLWDPVNDTVTGNIALVPVFVWNARRSIIIAQKDEFGEWESFDELLSANLSGLETAPEIYNKYGRRFWYLYRDDDVVELDYIKIAYQIMRKGYSAIKFFYDKECTHEITEDFVSTSTITPIYYTEERTLS